MRARDPIEENIKLIEQKHQQLGKKTSDLEDRSRWNKLQFSRFTEKAKVAKTWEESEKLIKKFYKKNLEMENKDITIERAHRTGSKTNGKKCYYCKSFKF